MRLPSQTTWLFAAAFGLTCIACGDDKKKAAVEAPPANVPPIAVLTVAGSSMLGESLVVDATGSYDPDGSDVTLAYDFGDGATAGGGGLLSLPHAFAVTGDYLVSLTVTDELGGSTTVRRQVSVRAASELRPSPTACFTGPSSAFAHQAVVFDAACSLAPDASLAYGFNFGDGSNSEGRIVAHTFAASGVFRVSLLTIATYADSTTAVATMTADIAVTDATVAIGAIEPSSGGVVGGDWITVKGQGFTTTTDTTITVGGVAVADFTVVDSHTIVLRTPSGIAGNATVQIRNRYGIAELATGFTYLGGSNRADSVYCPVDAQSGGTSLGFATNDDDAVRDVALPFAFPWFETTIAAGSTLHVSSNGTLSFSSIAAPFANATIPSAGNPADLVAVFFDDLNLAASGQVYARTTGSAPNRILTLQWKNVKDNATKQENLDFQVSLYESSGDVKMQYHNNDWDGAMSMGQSATLGLQRSATVGSLASHNTTVLGLAPGGVVQRFAYENAAYLLATSKLLSVAGVNPQDEQLLPSGNSATLTFTKPVNSASIVTGSTVLLEDLTVGGIVPVDAALLGDKSVLQLTPQNRLAFGHKYRLRATTGVKDVNGKPLSQDPEQLACGATLAITDFTSDFDAGPQLVATSNGLPSGGGPIGIAAYVNPTNGKNTVLVAKDTPRLQSFYADDLNTNLQSFTVGSSLWDVAVHPGNTTAYVSDSGSANLRLINVADPTNLTSQGGSPIALAGGGSSLGLAVLPNGSKVFVANDSNDTVHVINTVTKLEIDTDGNGGNGTTPIAVTGGCTPYDVAVSNGKVYVTCDGTNRLIVINATTYAVSSIVFSSGGTRGHGIVAHPTLNRVFQANNNNGNVIVVDTATDSVLATIGGFSGGANMEAIAITADGRFLIVTDVNNDEVIVVDAATYAIVDILGGFNVPMGAAVIAPSYKTIVTNFGGDTLAVVE